jgi:hypothetical protein
MRKFEIVSSAGEGALKESWSHDWDTKFLCHREIPCSTFRLRPCKSRYDKIDKKRVHAIPIFPMRGAEEVISYPWCR